MSIRGRIYALRSPDTDRIYIGSTTRALYCRMAEHRRDMKLINKGEKLWRKTRATELLNYPNVFMDLIEEITCESKLELQLKEKEVILRFRDFAVNYADPVTGKKMPV